MFVLPQDTLKVVQKRREYINIVFKYKFKNHILTNCVSWRRKSRYKHAQ